MAKYKITFKQSVAKDLRKIPNSDVKKILTRIEALAINPRGEGCVKLTGEEKYRARQGTYRIIYEIRETELVVAVIKVGHRSSIYKDK
ncbi:type II toxin-antitoxin system RelE/ParE family toxin [Synechocystis sp. FACHB-383]|uniref:type II toxin-antitoxin system RelE family toxin n=1 Tax=unclassified Synechocystis TaxID=2640012 RepID=UPI0016851774|nr:MULTISPECIES: type II toxin-antitoxin system RelE/ParE family toxin [unclassified Synechocystis]MBD2655281.1 type II toxin-antitoxin system RelE/ParE family toxin [Synechocystis sp. FACHB-383]MBE9195323.1 type II toxin-antitoxin system RelE/ParE family toxin [Synechocystis sp. LEGE 06083]